MAFITSRKLLAVSGGGGAGEKVRMSDVQSRVLSVLVPNTRVPKAREKLVNPIDCFLLMPVVQSGKKGLLHTSKGTVRHFLLAWKLDRKNQMFS